MHVSQTLVTLAVAATAAAGPVGPQGGPSKPGQTCKPSHECKPGKDDGTFDYDALSLREVGGRNTLVSSDEPFFVRVQLLNFELGMASLVGAQVPAHLVLARCATLPQREQPCHCQRRG